MRETPASQLSPPEPDQPIPWLVDQFTLSIGDFASPAHLLLWTFDQICGCNPVEWAAEKVAGDWNAMARAGVAVENLARFHTAYADQLRAGADTIRQSWTGNAATAAGEYFDDLAQVVADQAEPLRELGNSFSMVAYGMWADADALAGIIEIVLDIAIQATLDFYAAMLAEAAGPAGQPTAVAMIARAYQRIREATVVWSEALEWLDRVQLAVKAFIGTVGVLVASLKRLEQHPLPSAAYDYPGVGA